MNFEILAPAGSMEMLIAGVRCGANAIYLGGKLFNARRNAGNFNTTELKDAVAYCHSRNVKVYLTLNILLSDNELEGAYNLVKEALQAGVDAFIVQDIGVIKMIKKYFPFARLHGSTQMSILSPSGVEYAKSLGLKRVVLPREMSVDEIKQISKSTDLELEIFVHGALCMSVSGQCYMSSMIGTRSGNRGLCAQPCRLPFNAGGREKYALSLKDNSLINHLNEMDGICSLKIEGRMKRPEYVAAAVTAVKKAIDGVYTNEDEALLRSVFSRSGFTSGYFTGKRQDMFGFRQKEDVLSAKNVLKQISHTYDNENPLIPIDIDFICKNGEAAVLTLTTPQKQATVLGDVAQKAINKPMTSDNVGIRLSKLGGTQYFAKNVTVTIDDGLILPVSKINELRRKAVEKLDRQDIPRIIARPYHTEKYDTTPSKKILTASFKSANQIPSVHLFDIVFIPINSTQKEFIDNNAGVVLPRGLFGCEEKIRHSLAELKKIGVKKALCGNIGTYRLAKELGFEVYGDFGLNIFNSVSANEFDNPMMSFELSLSKINLISAKNKAVIVYGKVPLMLARNCPVKNSIGCAKCGKNGKLTDRKGMSFEVICSDYPCVEILNCVPIYMLDRLDEVKADNFHFYFSTETKSEIEKIVDMYANSSKPDFKFTRGLYYRNID